jgi:hypothetical protein
MVNLGNGIRGMIAAFVLRSSGKFFLASSSAGFAAAGELLLFPAEPQRTQRKTALRSGAFLL